MTATDAAGASSSTQVALVIGSAGSDTIRDEGRGTISAVGPNYPHLKVGTRKLIRNASTVITVDTASGVRHAIDGNVHAGMTVEWVGLRDKATTTVLAGQITVD